MKIKKMYQGVIPANKIMNTRSESNSDTYSCDYLNKNSSSGGNKFYPGYIYISTDPTSPANLYGGTWEVYGSGRTLVGVDTSQTEFNTVGKTGGDKTVTLTEAQMPSHYHSGNTNTTGGHSHDVALDGNDDYRVFYRLNWGANQTGCIITPVSTGGQSTAKAFQSRTLWSGDHAHSFDTNSKGSGQAHNNLPPYITVYMWRKISD